MKALDRYGFCDHGVLSYVTGRAEISTSATLKFSKKLQLEQSRANQLVERREKIVAEKPLLVSVNLKIDMHHYFSQRYCKVSNVKVQRDYHQAMERIVSRYQEQETS